VTEPGEPAGEREPSDPTSQLPDDSDAHGLRPSVMQAVSARLPAVLVEMLNKEATRRGVRPSELIRQAIEALLRGESGSTAGLNASVGNQMTVMTPLSHYRTENANLVVEVCIEPSQVVALGYS
jgi:hypothetical protein